MADATIADAAGTSPTAGAAHAVKDKPWVMRTYAGHSSPRKSNALYLRNLDKGQTGLSIAFDLPTQTGYDPDSPMARSGYRSRTSATCANCSSRSLSIA